MQTKPFVAFGPGFSGDYDTREEAQAVVARNGGGSVYVQESRIRELERELEEKESARKQWADTALRYQRQLEGLEVVVGAPAGGGVLACGHPIGDWVTNTAAGLSYCPHCAKWPFAKGDGLLLARS